MVINKNNRYLEEKEDHYVMSNLFVNDDLTIELDKRLHVVGNVFIAGGLTKGTISADGTIVIYGLVQCDSLQGHKIACHGQAFIEKDIVVTESLLMNNASIKGTVVSNGNIIFNKDSFISGNISAKDILVAKGSLGVSGNIAAGTLIDIHNSFRCGGEMRVMGRTFTEYGRLSTGEETIILADNMGFVINGNYVVRATDDIDKALHSDDAKDCAKGKTIWEKRDWICNIKNKVEKEGE